MGKIVHATDPKKEELRKQFSKERLEKENKEKTIINPKQEEEEFKKNVEDLKENPFTEWDEENILKEFETYPSLRSIFFNVVANQPTMNLMIRIGLGYEEEFKSQVGKQLKKLKRMGLINEVLVCECWWKNHLNEKLGLTMKISDIEKSMLKKIKLHKDTEERKRNALIGNSGFWFLTDLGKTIFPKVKNLIQQKKKI